jgi:CheY-like chemotaxis protein
MKRILIIEDDPIAGAVYQRFLQSNGFVTDLAIDGAKGLERVSEFGPDAVVLDLMMPKVSGVDVLQTLRAHEAFQKLPIVVITNAYVPAFVERAIQAGASHVFDKSKDPPSAILGMLRRLLEATAGNT